MGNNSAPTTGSPTPPSSTYSSEPRVSESHDKAKFQITVTQVASHQRSASYINKQSDTDHDDDDTSTTADFISQYGSHFSQPARPLRTFKSIDNPRRLAADHLTSPTTGYSEHSASHSISSLVSMESITFSDCASTNSHYSNGSSLYCHTKVAPSMASEASQSPRSLSATPVPHDAESLFVPANGSIQVHTLWRCQPVLRMIRLLSWHARSTKRCDGHQLLRSQVCKRGYKKIVVEDYQHLLSVHVLDFDSIRKKVDALCGSVCHKETCKPYSRLNELCNMDLSKYDDETFCVKFADLVHCYVMHA